MSEVEKLQCCQVALQRGTKEGVDCSMEYLCVSMWAALIDTSYLGICLCWSLTPPPPLTNKMLLVCGLVNVFEQLGLTHCSPPLHSPRLASTPLSLLLPSPPFPNTGLHSSPRDGTHRLADRTRVMHADLPCLCHFFQRKGRGGRAGSSDGGGDERCMLLGHLVEQLHVLLTLTSTVCKPR